MNAKGLTFKYYTKQHQRSGKKFEKIERRKKGYQKTLMYMIYKILLSPQDTTTKYFYNFFH